MKKIMLLCSLVIVTTGIQAQKVTFISEEFEAGVKSHLRLGETDDVVKAQTDTITTINLSGREIADISDVLSLPNVTWLDLGDNLIEDVSPLASLEHLHYVNLIRNELEDINPLVFACTDSLHVNVAENYIKDYTYLFSVTSCQLLIEGMGAQKQEKNAPFFDVYQLYADVSKAGVPLVSYRGFTNVEGDVTLECGSMRMAATMDGYTNSVLLPNDLNLTTQATLSNGEVGDTTWVVPPTAYDVTNGGEVMISTGLPESYQIGYLRALHGTVEADGTTLHYVASTRAVNDTLYLSYYENEQIKGFTELYIKTPQTATEVKDIPQEPPLQVSLDGNVLSIAGLSESVTAVKVYDALGRLLVMETPDKGQDMTIRLPGKQAVVIVEVTCGERRIVKKISE